ncbi:hypothetical protein [Streptomyces atratus]|uniref:hypothetical protein n=1 Tax=Streptomyces atratus TaxID=1893 RepID=UPI00365A2780
MRAITLTHHGKVTAAHRPGGGLTVRVDLPHRTHRGLREEGTGRAWGIGTGPSR